MLVCLGMLAGIPLMAWYGYRAITAEPAVAPPSLGLSSYEANNEGQVSLAGRFSCGSEDLNCDRSTISLVAEGSHEHLGSRVGTMSTSWEAEVEEGDVPRVSIEEELGGARGGQQYLSVRLACTPGEDVVASIVLTAPQGTIDQELSITCSE